jgi:FtsP/CotA-like multicopper oxidase with cupredoxin domain
MSERRDLPPDLFRRDLLRAGLAGVVGGGGLGAVPEALAQTPRSTGEVRRDSYVPRPDAASYRFSVGATTLDPDLKKPVAGITVNGRFPGPEIRVKEGSMLRVEVRNALKDEPTAIHWHGLLVPAGMDGVPDVANYPIPQGRTYVYEYPIRQSGTYWYHSHWGLQEQIGLAGPFIIEPVHEPLQVDHDVVIFIADWLHGSPYAALEGLKKGPKGGMDMGKGGASKGGGAPMKMDESKPDLADLEYDAFLINGRGTQSPWTYAARPGERIRLRLVNTGASTYFNVRLDGHPLTITHADGLAVEPVTVDHVLMGMAECYDAVVTLSRPGSYTLHAVALDGSAQAVGVLHTPGVAPNPNLAMPRFDGRALSYRDLRAVAPTTLPNGPVRALDLALQGDMMRYVWSINGQVYPKTDPLLIRQGERVQIDLRNETGMLHPMHLHGHFFRVLQGAGERAPLKHTVNVNPKETVRIEFIADNPGRWIFHCHNLYHFEAGMARVFEYEA